MRTKNRDNLALWIIIGCQSVVIIALYLNRGSALEIVGWLLTVSFPTLFALYGQLQKRNLSFFLLSQQLINLFRSNVPSWNFNVQFQGDIYSDSLQKIHETVINTYPSSEIKVHSIDAQTLEVIFQDGPNFEVSLNLDVIENNDLSILIRVRNYRVGFRETRQVLASEIMPILELIKDTLKPIDTTYRLIINFDKDKNPFLGMYLAKFDPNDVVSFNVKLHFDAYGSKNIVEISESKLYLTTTSRSAVENLAAEFLTFDLKLREHL